jgi:uncharacterized protein (TIGR04255 family)
MSEILMKTLLKVEKCPIIDLVCEIRFESGLPSDIVSGMIVEAIGIDGRKLEKLDISKFPAELLEQDINLKYQPHFRYDFGGIYFLFGSRVCSFSSKMPYPGWDIFFGKVQEILEKIKNRKIINQVVRVGYRVINFFETDIITKLQYKVQTPISSYQKQYNYTNLYEVDGISIKVLIANGVGISNPTSHQTRLGSIIDIDSFIENNKNNDLSHVISLIDKAHAKSKKMFSDHLTKELSDELGATYEE